MAVVIGVVCGVAAGLPTSLLLLVGMARRDHRRLDELEQQQSGKVRDLDNRLAQQLKEQEDRIGKRVQELSQFATDQLDQLQQQLRHTHQGQQ